MSWEVTATVGLDNQFKTPMRTVHVYPLEDLIPHLWSKNCPCEPKRDEQEPSMMVHNALDGRERYEGIRRDQ